METIERIKENVIKELNQDNEFRKYLILSITDEIKAIAVQVAIQVYNEMEKSGAKDYDKRH